MSDARTPLVPLLLVPLLHILLWYYKNPSRVPGRCMKGFAGRSRMLLLGRLISERQSVARMPLTNQRHPLLCHPQ